MYLVYNLVKLVLYLVYNLVKLVLYLVSNLVKLVLYLVSNLVTMVLFWVYNLVPLVLHKTCFDNVLIPCALTCQCVCSGSPFAKLCCIDQACTHTTLQENADQNRIFLTAQTSIQKTSCLSPLVEAPSRRVERGDGRIENVQPVA